MNEGDKAPAIMVSASDGSSINLASPGQPLVLYFYPKDDTSGCTLEAQNFTQLAPDFKKAGVKVIGVSRDPMKKHEKFIAKYDLAVPLASDEDGRISDEQILDHYSPEDIVEITGTRGTILAADTRGFHKGKPVQSGERLLLQIEYATSLFGAPYEKVTLNEKFSTEFQRHVNKHVRVFSMYVPNKSGLV